jgi:hypothetical protein
LDEILAVDGQDGLLIGPGGPSAQPGYLGSLGGPKWRRQSRPLSGKRGRQSYPLGMDRRWTTQLSGSTRAHASSLSATTRCLSGVAPMLPSIVSRTLWGQRELAVARQPGPAVTRPRVKTISSTAPAERNHGWLALRRSCSDAVRAGGPGDQASRKKQPHNLGGRLGNPAAETQGRQPPP